MKKFLLYLGLKYTGSIYFVCLYISYSGCNIFQATLTWLGYYRYINIQLVYLEVSSHEKS